MNETDQVRELAELLAEVEEGDPLRWQGLAITPEEARHLIAQHLKTFLDEVAGSTPNQDAVVSVLLIAMGHLLLENMQLHAERILRETGKLFDVNDWLTAMTKTNREGGE